MFSKFKPSKSVSVSKKLKQNNNDPEKQLKKKEIDNAKKVIEEYGDI